MFIYKLEKNIALIYINVPQFPLGIQEAFDELYDKFKNRDYYGLSHLDAQQQVIYKAAAAAFEQGEASQHGYHSSHIPAGDYLAEKVTDWMSKTETLKAIFMELMSDPRFDEGTACGEWYQSDDEMLCMVRCK